MSPRRCRQRRAPLAAAGSGGRPPAECVDGLRKDVDGLRKDGDRSDGRGCDQGMVTLEVAFGLPVILLAALIAGWLLAAGQMQVRLTDAARATARELARGEPASRAVAAGEAVAGGARITVVRDDSVIEVVAEREFRGPGPVLGRLHRELRAEVTTRPEELPW